MVNIRLCYAQILTEHIPECYFQLFIIVDVVPELMGFIYCITQFNGCE